MKLISWLLVFVVSNIPRSWIRWWGRCFAVFWFDIVRFRRQIVLDNLLIAFPQSTLDWRIQVGRKSIEKLCANAFEFFSLPTIDEAWIKKNVVYEGWENLEQAKAKGKGVLLVSLHMGPYDIAASLMPMRGQETFLISKFFKNKKLNDMWFGIRGSQGMKFIEPHGTQTAFDIFKALKKNAGVIFVIDQYMGPPFGIPTTFFGQPTGTAYGLSLFYMKTKSPVVPVYSTTDENGKIHLIFEKEVPMDFLIQDDKDQSIQDITQKMNAIIEQIVTKYPNEWLWIHRRWKEYG